MKIKNQKVKIFLDYTEIFLSAVLMALNYELFVIKNNFAPSGINGIATMIQYKTGFSIGYMSLIVNIPLCIFAYFFINKKFARRSFFYCVTYSLVYILLQQMDLSAFQYDSQGHDTIFPVILSGVIGGFVYSFCFFKGASTGGTDIFSKYISKIKPELNFFYINFAQNAVVAITAIFVYAQPNETNALVLDYKPTCLCILYCFISTFVGNYFISGTKKACKFTVITTHPDEITKDIFDVLKHGTTKVEAIGSYNNEEKAILLCVVNCHQIVDFKKILQKYDNTFAYSETVNETYGNFLKVK